MKLKEIDRTANVAWSPSSSKAIYLAAGTAAQQLDSSFSSNAVLELYFFDINQPGLDMALNAALPCESRFHKLIWGSHGIPGSTQGDGDHPSGLIVAGCDNGLMQVYDAAKVLNNDEEPIILTKNKHTGPVRALDFNSFRPHIVASGASDSEIFIWDFNNPKTAMSTGTKSQPSDDVTHLAWNKQVEHILASTFSTRCVMWDLRKNEPIIKVADTTSRIRYKAVEWHPTVATQMCLASEDDSSPVIQLWDLRYATAPLKVLQGHQRGVLGLAWCQQDPELLLSCGKDSNIMCWNPNYPHPGYELLCEMPTTSQWSFDVSFCPRNPLVISSSSFDGRVSIFGLSGGAQQPVTSSKLADSFPGMDMDISQTPVPAQKPQSIQLRDAPKWLKRPCGASFAFGGKLIKFENIKNTHGQGQPDQRLVTISQVVTLPEFLARSQKLEAALASGNLGEFCEQKSNQTIDANESRVWQYLRASFSHNPTLDYLDMLGFNPNTINGKLASVVGKPETTDPEVDALTDGFVSLAQGDSFGNQIPNLDNGAIFDEIHQKSGATPEVKELVKIQTDENTEGLLNQALLAGNIEYAVDLCLKEERWPEAFILASCGGPDVIRVVQQKYFKKCKNTTPDMLKIVVTQDWQRLVEGCDLKYWQQALATLLTHVRNEKEFAALAGVLGQRLEASDDENLRKSAMVCYICSGNMDRLADSWTKVIDVSKSDGANSLQDLVEQVTVLRKAAEARGRREALNTGPLSSKMVEYGTLLASQGSLESALKYLSDSTDPSMVNLKERIQYALGYQFHRPSGIAPRSRQTSESSSYRHSSLSNKRPSYSSNVNTYQPMTSSMSNGYSNVSNTYNPSSSAYNPPSNTYNQPTTFNPPTYAPPAPANPAPTLPLPPISSSAPGWNDPPALLAQSKPKPAFESQEPITHPIYGSGPVPNAPGPVPNAPGSHDYGHGMGAFGMPNAPPPPKTSMPPAPLNTGSTFGSSVPMFQGGASVPTQPPPSAVASAGPPPNSAYKPGSVSAFAQRPPLPPSASSFSQTLFTPAPSTGPMTNPLHSQVLPPSGYSSEPLGSGYSPGISSFTPGPPSSTGFHTGPPATTGYSTGPASSTGFPPGPPSSGFSSGPPVGSFPPGPPSSGGFNAGPPPSSAFPPGPPASTGFSTGPPPSSFAAGPPPPSGFAPGSGLRSAPPPVSSFGATPATTTNLTSPPSSSFASGPPPSSGFTPATSNVFTPGMHSTRGFSPAQGLSSEPLRPPPLGRSSPMPEPFGTMPPASQYAGGTTFSPPVVSTSLKGSRPPSAQSLSSAPPTAGFTPGPSINAPSYATLPGTTASQQQLPPIMPFIPDPTTSNPWESVTSQPNTSFGGPPSAIPTADAFPPSTFSPPPMSQVSSPPPTQSNVRQAVEAEPKPTGPIPDEHRELVDVLEKLRSECYNIAGLPQIKRKLEDVARKMEILSDKLREGSLSASTLTSLHNIVDAMKNRDYQLALSIHTQLVTAGNFAEISSFLPSIKVLIQSAAQLNVFL